MTREHLVVMRLTALGDAILTEPFLRALKAQHPQAILTFVTGEAQAPLFRTLPYLDRVVGWSRGRHAGWGGLRRLAREIREAGPVAQVVDLQNKLRTRVLTSLLAPRRSHRWQRRSMLGALSALAGRDPVLGAPHATRRYFTIPGLPAPGEGPLAPRLTVPETALARIEGPWARGTRPVALAPAARWETKRWAPDRMAALGRRLRGAGHPIVLVAGPGDDTEVEAFLAAFDGELALDARALSLVDLAAVLSRCAVLVAGDTGPGHLAAAVGTPVVSLFGPTHPDRWAPAHPGGRVVGVPLACRPCSNHGTAACPLGHHRCLVDLEVEAVAAATQEVLAARPSAGRAG